MDMIRGGAVIPAKLRTTDDIRGRNRAMVELDRQGFKVAQMMNARGQYV